MKAVGFKKHLPISDSQSFLDAELPKPNPEKRDLLVAVRAVSVNPVDTKVRGTKTINETADLKVIGWDVAGVVVAKGEATSLFEVGDEVFYAGSRIRSGGNSEYHLVDERIVGRKPRNFSFAEAAAIPLTAVTAWESLFERLPFSMLEKNQTDQTILIINGAGGVGSSAIQLAKLAGLKVITTAVKPESIAWVKKLGADLVLDHYQPLLPQLQEQKINEVDAILCLHSVDKHWQNMVACIKPEGHICAIVDNQAPVMLNELKDKSVTFSWEFMFTKSKYQTPDMISQHNILMAVSQLIEAGKLQSVMTKMLAPINADNLKKAHQIVEEGRMVGKTVLKDWA